jgi:TRAP-type uncharacterized transport system fused permease subunit
MACLGNFAFASATQGWLVAKNRFYELPLLLAATFILMRPDAIASLLGVAHEKRFWMYLIGLAVFGVICLMQWPRRPREAAPATA